MIAPWLISYHSGDLFPDRGAILPFDPRCVFSSLLKGGMEVGKEHRREGRFLSDLVSAPCRLVFTALQSYSQQLYRGTWRCFVFPGFSNQTRWCFTSCGAACTRDMCGEARTQHGGDVSHAVSFLVLVCT
jgi:hypothetical protein